MDDITNDYRFQRLLIEAAQYRTIRRIIDADRDYDPKPSAKMDNNDSPGVIQKDK